MASENKDKSGELQAASDSAAGQSEPQPVGKEGSSLLAVEEEKAPFLPPSAPIREDFVQNAVNFLRHPNVKGSPIKFRRSFLEKKGLTAEEIDEAFRRVPDAPTGDAAVDASSTATSPPVSNAARTVRIPAQQQNSQPIQALQQPQQSALPPQQYALQPIGAPPAQLGSGQLYAPMQPQLAGHMPLAPAPAGMRWPQMILALGVIGAGGAATALLAQKYALPKMQQWLQSLASSKGADGKGKTSPVEEAAAAAATAASAAASATKELIQARAEEKERTDAMVKALEAQTSELRSALSSLQEALSTAKPGSPESDPRITVADLRKELRNFANVITDFAPAPPASTSSSQAPAGLQSELAEIKQLLQAAGPATANGPSSVELAARGSTLAASPTAAAVQVPVLDGLGPGAGSVMAARPASAPADGRLDQPRHPQSYMEVLEMVQKGEKPPGIRDINDKPPDPTRPLSDSTMAPRPKPWERGAAAGPPQQLSASWHASPAGGSPALAPATTRAGFASPDSTPATATAAAAAAGAGASSDTSPWWHRRNPQSYGARPTASPVQPAPVQYNEWGAPVYSVAPARPAAPGWQAPPGVAISEAEETQSETQSVPGEAAGPGSRPSQGGMATSSNPMAASGSSGSSANAFGSENGGGAPSWGRPGWVPPPVPQPVLPEVAAAIRARPPEKEEALMPSPAQQSMADEWQGRRLVPTEERHGNDSQSVGGFPDGAGGSSSAPIGGALESTQPGHHESAAEPSGGSSEVNGDA